MTRKFTLLKEPHPPRALLVLISISSMRAVSISNLLLFCVVSTSLAIDVVVKVISVESPESVPDHDWKEFLELMVWNVFEIKHYAVQIFKIVEKETSVLCEKVGNVDRAKHPSDFVLVVANDRSPLISCDSEWGKQNFAIVRVDMKIAPSENQIKAWLFPDSSDTNSTATIQIKKMDDIMEHVDRKRVDYSQSLIPEDYPEAMQKQQVLARRTYLAIIAILVLVACALLMIMFMNSLSRFNAKKKIEKDKIHQKKKTDEIISRVEKKLTEKANENKGSGEVSIKVTSPKTTSPVTPKASTPNKAPVETSEKKTDKSEKSEKKDDKSEKSDSQKSEKKEDKSEKSEKSEKAELAIRKSALKKGLTYRVAKKDDKDLLAQLFQARTLKDPHYKSAGCTAGELSPMTTYKVEHALKYDLSLIVEDTKGKPSGFSVVTVANRNANLDLNKNLNRPAFDKDSSYYYISRVYKFCKMHFWTILPPIYEKVAIIEGVNLQKAHVDAIGILLQKTVDMIKLNDPKIEGVACVATNNNLLKGLDEAGFLPLFSAAPELYYMADQTNWTPKDDLQAAKMMFRPFNDVVTDKLKANVTVGEDWQYKPYK